jgi:hypothetical protein
MEQGPNFHLGESEIKPIFFCGKPLLSILRGRKGIYSIPYPIKPTEGVHNCESCADCKRNKAKISFEIESDYRGAKNNKAFPNCCLWHKNLVNDERFKKEDFDGVSGITADKILFAYQHIINNQNETDWYKRITDYLNEVQRSFGQMPENCGEPLFYSVYVNYVTDMLRNNSEFPLGKKNKILEYFNPKKQTKDREETDLNILIELYERWLKIFPFEMNSYFGELKAHFENRVPLVDGAMEVNLYSGIPSGKLFTKQALFEFLLKTTNELLTSLNALTLHEKGLLKDPHSIDWELHLTERKKKLEEGYNNTSPNEDHRFRAMIKDWFNDEKIFVKGLIDKLEHEAKVKNEQPEQEINHFCKSMSLSIPIEHFRPMTIEKSRNGKPFLTEEAFEAFIARAFKGLNNIPKQSINCVRGRETKTVTSFFVLFYHQYCIDYFGKSKCRKQFAQLLTEHFDGYTLTRVLRNFR